jgi:flagellar hook-associated protein 2
MAISATGLGSSLDVNGLVSQLMAIERQPVAALDKRAAGYQSELTAYGKVKSALSGFQDALSGLTTQNSLRAATATAADATIATASATASATPGSYDIEIDQLAQQHKLATTAFAGTGDTLGSGTITIQFGTWSGSSFTANAAKAVATVNIGAANASLSGVRDAVNAADIGVRANLINDGTGYRLVLTSTDGGEANSMRITVADDDAANSDTSGLSRLAYDPAASAGSGRNLAQISAAQNAVIRIDGLTLSQGTNVVSRAIDGLSITATKVGSTTVTVAQDTAKTKAALQGMVTAYNDLDKVLRDQTAYNASTKTGGPLLGDASARRMQSEIRSTLSGVIDSLPAGMNSLSAIGLRFQSDGKLKLDESKLDSVLSTNFKGAAAILAAWGSPSDSLIPWAGSSAASKPGSYAISVSQIATQGRLTGDSSAALVIQAGVNDTLELSIDGRAASITLAAGTYASASALAAELQSVLNGNADVLDAGASVSLSETAGALSIVSDRYGASSAVLLTGGNGATDLFGASPLAQAGVDVAGMLNGAAATGAGQILSGATGNDAEGLRVRVLGGPTGARGALTYTVGIATRLDRLISAALDDDGSIASRISGIESSIKTLRSRQDSMNERLSSVEARYRAQFVALDTMLAKMNTTSSFLQSQLASLG